MVCQYPPQLPWSVGGVLGTDRLEALSAQFQVTKSDGILLSIEVRSGWEIHALLGRIFFGVDLSFVYSVLILLDVNQNGMVHLLHWLFSALVSVYPTSHRIFSCLGNILEDGLPPVEDIPVCDFNCAVRHLCHTAGGSPQSPGGFSPARLVVDAVREGREYDARRTLSGLPGSDHFSPVLRHPLLAVP